MALILARLPVDLRTLEETFDAPLTTVCAKPSSLSTKILNVFEAFPKVLADDEKSNDRIERWSYTGWRISKSS